jgi:cell shape-determining protein MreC
MQAILKWLLNFILGWALSSFQEWFQKYQERKKAEQENKELREKLEKAETKEERDEAASDIANRF